MLFLALSIEEVTALRERAIRPLAGIFRLSGFLAYAWIVPATALVAVFAAAYLPFPLHLPSQVRVLFLLAGLLYVGGAIRMEAVGGYLFETFGWPSIRTGIGTTIEELLEMSGVVVFIYALLLYLEERVGMVRIRVGR